MTRILSLFVMFMLFGVLAFAQNRVVTGTVTDEKGNSVEGASIRVVGTKLGTASDQNGNFRLLNVAPGAMLRVSGVGIPQQDLLASTNVTNFSVKRTEGTELNTVIVTALGIRRQPKELGYATTTINSTELNQAKVVNVATGLAGKVSGLQINLVNNGVKPSVRVTLRGNRSILGNNQALLVVDDIQLPISYFEKINGNDVENVTVLKGASASALYGSSASNGVIIVTTKKGTRGKPQIRLSSTVSFENIAYLSKFQNEFGQSSGEGGIYSPGGGSFPACAGCVYIPGNPYVQYVPYENQNYGPRFNGQRIALGAPIRVYKPDGTYVIGQDSSTYAASPNARENFFNTGVTTQNDVSYSAGDDKSRFYLSFQDVNTKGTVPSDVSRRNSIHLNGSRESGIFRADVSIGYTLTHTNTTPGQNVPFDWQVGGAQGGYGGSGGSYFQNRPVFYTVINSPANLDLRRFKNWKVDPFSNPDGYFNAYYGNPWWAIDQTRLDEKSNDVLASLAFTVTPTSWLSFKYKAGIARTDYVNKYTRVGYDFAPWAIADTLGAGNIPSGVKVLAPQVGDGRSYNQRLTSDLYATIKKDFAKNFDLNLILGTSLIVNRYQLSSTNAVALVVPNFYNISNRVGEAVIVDRFEERRNLGVFGDLTLGYKKFLYLHSSLRNDMTSLLSPANRSFLYPAADLAFIFTDAFEGLKRNDVFSFGKVRAAYSRTAQVSIGAYSLQNTFNAAQFGSTPGFTVNSAYANPNIKPEISKDREVGLELGFLKNRIYFTGAYYSVLTNNQTIPIAITPATGFTSAFVNSGSMSNKGYELDLKVTAISPRNENGLKLDLGANYSHNDNKVVSLGYGLDEVFLGGNSYASVGRPYPSIKVDDWKRDPQGRIIVDKNSGYPTLDPTQKFVGTANPPDKVGLTTSIKYKGLTLGVVADGRFGAIIYNALGSDLDFTGVSAFSASSGRQPFVIPNSVIDAGGGKYEPNTSNVTRDGNLGFWSSVWNQGQINYVNSADFWKIREISLGYELPKSLMTKAIKAASFQISARNVYTRRAKQNVWSDPEFANTTGNGTGTTDINQTPPTRFIAVSINLTF